MDFLAIVGPTASGKTELSLEVAKRLPSEVISVDSRQVYKGMDIGTAKATPEQRRQVPHHGLDLIDPDRSYSAGAFARDARGWIEEITERGRTPLLVGGTGFFLKALMEPLFSEPPRSAERARSLRAYLGVLPRERLETWVRLLDPDRAELAAEGGPQRMIRTLEVVLSTGRPLSWWHENAPPGEAGLDGLIAVVEVPREVLDARIDRRVVRMVQTDLVGEVSRLLEQGLRPDAPGMTGVGYREIVEFLDGASSAEEAVAAIRHATRRYSRRQRTWFRNQLPENGVLRLDGTHPVDRLADTVVRAWKDRTALAGVTGGTG